MNRNVLLEQLIDPDEEVRAEAREELTLQMDDDLARVFLDLIAGDGNEDVRADTVIGLGPIIEEAGMDFDDEDDFEWGPELGPGISRETFDTILREVQEVYKAESQPKLVRRRAFESLVRHPQPWQKSEIRQHFASGDRDWKLTAVFAMGYVPGFEKEIIELVSSGEGDFLFEAVRAAGNMDVKGAAGRIRAIAQSEDADRDLRCIAIEALQYVDPDCEDLLERLTESRDEEVAEVAAAVLEELSMLEEELDEED